MSTNRAVVVHVTSGDVDDWRLALRNISNLYQDESVVIPPELLDVVVNGAAVRFLVKSTPWASQLQAMSEAGIQIKVCGNSLAEHGMQPEDLVNAVDMVPSGVGEAVRLQSGNTAYLKLP